MKQTLLLLLAIPFCFGQKANAQHKTHEDSTEVINAAHRYAAAFRLRNKDMKKFHEQHFPASSDYFKPGSRVPVVLSSDSLFVKIYRTEAFDRALDQQSIPSFRDLLQPPHVRPGENTVIYTAPAQQAAQRDAQTFALDRTMLMRFKMEHFPATSDYFKPNKAYTANPAMLSDSTYVQTFRFEAYNRAYHQRENPVGHSVLIGGIIAVGTTIIVLIGIALSRANLY